MKEKFCWRRLEVCGRDGRRAENSSRHERQDHGNAFRVRGTAGYAGESRSYRRQRSAKPGRCSPSRGGPSLGERWGGRSVEDNRPPALTQQLLPAAAPTQKSRGGVFRIFSRPRVGLVFRFSPRRRPNTPARQRELGGMIPWLRQPSPSANKPGTLPPIKPTGRRNGPP